MTSPETLLNGGSVDLFHCKPYYIRPPPPLPHTSLYYIASWKQAMECHRMAHPTTRHVMRLFCINDGLQVDHVASLSRFTPAAGSLRQLTINRLHPRAHRLHPETAYHRASQRTTEPHSVPQSLTAYHRASQRTTEPHSVPQSLTAYHRASQRTTEPHSVPQSPHQVRL